jgi:outer membrane protein W
MKTNFKKASSLLILLFSIGLQQANAQNEKGGYVSINTGYSMGTGQPNTAAAYILQILNATEPSATTSTQEIAKINLGQGFNAGATFGYMFNKNIGLELGANYLMSSKTNTTNTSYSGDYRNNEISAKMIQIKPTIVFRGGYDKINPYAKLGMVIGSGKMILEGDSKDGGDTYNTTLELNEGTPIGFQGSLGTLYKINEKFSLFAELDLISLSYAPKRGEYTKFIVNGADVLSSMSVENKEIEFVDSFTNTGVSSPSTQPSKAPKVPFSFSSFGLNIGLQYNF